MDLTRLNDDKLARLWHAAQDTLEEQEKLLKESGPYVTAKDTIAAIEQILTQRLHDSGASSIATPHGTIHTVGRTTARIMDPETFRSHIITGQYWDGIDWKANMTWCRDQMEKTKQPVPGVELSVTRRLSITAPKGPKKKDPDDVE